MKLTKTEINFTHEEFHVFLNSFSLEDIAKTTPNFFIVFSILHGLVCHCCTDGALEGILKVIDINEININKIIKAIEKTLNDVHKDNYAKNWLINNV